MESEPNSPDGQVLYQIICLWDTPPLTGEEQHRCLHAAGGCWRANHPASRCKGNRNGKEAASDNVNRDGSDLDGEETDWGDQQERSNGRNGHEKSGSKKAKEAQEA
jgi:hypothetical protein